MSLLYRLRGLYWREPLSELTPSTHRNANATLSGMHPILDWAQEPATRWNDVWSMLNAIAAAAAVGVTVWLGWADRKHRREEMQRLQTERNEARAERDELRAARDRREDADRTERREAQARRVAVWHWLGPPAYRDCEAVAGVNVCVYNASDLPIFDVRTAYRVVGATLDQVADVILPDERQEAESVAPFEAYGRDDPSMRFVRFRDLSGHHWDRFADGRLRAVPANEVELTRLGPEDAER